MAQFTGKASIAHEFESNLNFAQFELGYKFKISKLELKPYTLQKSWFQTESPLVNDPLRHVYKLGFSISKQFGKNRIYIDAYHYCSHVVLPSAKWSDNNKELSGLYPKNTAGWLDDMNGTTNIIELGFEF